MFLGCGELYAVRLWVLMCMKLFLCSFVQIAFVRPKEKSLFLIFVARKLSLKELFRCNEACMESADYLHIFYTDFD